MKNKFKNLMLSTLLCLGGIIYGQTSKVTGVVSDALGPLPGVNILLKGTTNGIVTDFNGNFQIPVKKGDVLVVSFLGYLTKEVPYGGESTIKVILTEDSKLLNEVVVVGYGKSVKKTDLTGSVAMVGAADIDRSPLTTVDQALQGRAAGVAVTQSSGAPGAAAKVRIRGSNSITGSNAPLVVVDGLIDVDINSVNPADILSMSILKDASSTAIYGNRGANGVILITTKKGSDGKPIIEFGTYTSFSEVTNTEDLLNAKDFITYANIKNVKATGNPIPVFNTQQKIDAFLASETDYQDATLRTAIANNYQLSFRGGTDKMNYYISGNALNQDGVIINTNYKRYALRSNINADLSSKLKLSTNVNLIRGYGKNSDVGLNNDIASAMVIHEPVNPIYLQDGRYLIGTLVKGGVQENLSANPVWMANETKRDNISTGVQANAQLNYNLLKNLDFNLSGGIDYGNNERSYFNPAQRQGAPITAGKNSFTDNKTQYALRFTYSNIFNEKHNLNASYIFEERQNKSSGYGADGSGFYTSSVGYDNLGIADKQTIYSGVSERSLRSNIVRANYTYDSRYLITASGRYDESSVFINEQGAFFPSFSLGWNINNEAFFKSELISELRIRGGYGLTGNELIGTNDVLSLLENNPWIPDGLTPTTAIIPGSRLANPDLTWETTKQFDIGFDFGILKNRINLTFDYYSKTTDDLLLTKKVPQYTGKVDQVINAGVVENKGFEVTLSGKVVQNDNFSWDTNLNLSSNKNEVISLVDNETQFFPSIFGNISVMTVKVGEPIGSLYGYVYEGVDATNGNAIYAPERTIIGNSNPDFTYGFNNNMYYKNFELNFFFQGVEGNDIFNIARSKTLGRSGDVPFGTSAELVNTWTPTNTSAPLPSISATNTQLESSEFVEDGSYFRLKNIALGYNFKNAKSLTTIGVESLRLYVSAQNLFTVTNYSGRDPEVNSAGSNDLGSAVDFGALPNSKTFTLGLNLKF